MTTTLERIEALHTKFDQFFSEYLRDHVLVVSENRRAHERIDRMDKDFAEMRIEIIEIKKLMPWVKAGAYLLASISIPMLLASIWAIWALITHQSTFP